MKNQKSNDIYSVVWLASPYKLSNNTSITFKWGADFSFQWLGTGRVLVGKVFSMNGFENASIPKANKINFNVIGRAPLFSKAKEGSQKNTFIIKIGSKVPNNTFATGIGVSEHPSFVKTCLANTTQVFEEQYQYAIGAAQHIQMGQILPFTGLSSAKGFSFPPNTQNLKATLGQNNLWKVES